MASGPSDHDSEPEFDRDEHWRLLMERRAERDRRLEEEIEQGETPWLKEEVDGGGEPLGILEAMREGRRRDPNPVQEAELEKQAAAEKTRARAQRALGGLVLAIAAIAAVLVVTKSPPYQVTAEFANASQVTTGAEVTVGGTAVGSVEKVELGDDGDAELALSITDPDFAPLYRGTIATVRSTSLSGVANRQIALSLPATAGEEIEDGATLEQSETVSEVDLDEIFNTLDTETVADLKKVIRGFEISYDGVGPEANKGLRYLNPFLSTSRRLFSELALDQRALEQLLIDGDRLTGALADRRDEIPALISNLDLMMGAIGREKIALASAVKQLPDFMRLFNTTGVNLRFALDDLDPLVDASKPAAKKLQPFFSEFRIAARNLVPTVQDLDKIILDPGKDNDLVDLTALQLPLAEIAVGPVTRNGAEREGAFPSSTASLTDSLDELAFFRAYTPELVGWFNDFGRSGIDDANGGIGRISVQLNTFTISPATGLPQLFAPPLSGTALAGALDTHNFQRCPGGNERPPSDGSGPFTDGGTLACDPSMVPPGE